MLGGLKPCNIDYMQKLLLSSNTENISGKPTKQSWKPKHVSLAGKHQVSLKF